MFDESMRQQLQGAFAVLGDDVLLRVLASDHPDQGELVTMVESLAQTSDRIRIERSPLPSSVPTLHVCRPDQAPRIIFRGVPGGHEFTSLVLAILYVDQKGRIPDEGILRRIRALKGPIRLRTYMSLSCENCPDVVQALNLFAALHTDFIHETIDGAVAQDDIARFGIQGVPSVVAGDATLIHSGKSTLLDLLLLLEKQFGSTAIGPDSTVETHLGRFDVVVIGGGPAGASAAIYSARKGLNTALVAERIGGQLLDTRGIENMISMPYTEGVKLSAELATHMRSYPIRTLEHRRVQSITKGPLKRITFESGETLDAQTLIVATGAQWRTLGIPGEKEHIGLGVAFCAHCDGPFYKQKRVVVVGGGNSGVEAAIDLSSLATHVTLLEYGPTLKADDVLVDKLRNISNATIITQAKSVQVLGENGKVVGLEYLDLSTQTLKRLVTDGVFVQIGLSPNSSFVRGLVETTPAGEIIVDAKGRTSEPGIYAAGDVTTVPYKQIVIAMGEGAKVALTAFEDRMRSS